MERSHEAGLRQEGTFIGKGAMKGTLCCEDVNVVGRVCEGGDCTVADLNLFLEGERLFINFAKATVLTADEYTTAEVAVNRVNSSFESSRNRSTPFESP